MAGRVRIFSELMNDDSEGLLNKLKETIPRQKRRRTGLNAQFDNMVQKMNVLSPPRKHRKRASSKGSSSVSSYDLPKTPIDSAYDELSAGKLGETFSVIKMNDNTASDCHSMTTAHLPDWLSETFSSLSKDNPLRLLLPDNERSGPPTFAFWPEPESLPDGPLPASSPASSSSPLLPPATIRPKTAAIPDVFSTPGPCYYTSRPTPTEEPSSDPGYSVEDLRFEWQPFDRKSSVSENIAAPIPLFPDVKPIGTLDLLDPERVHEVHARAQSPARFRFSAPSPLPETAVVPSRPVFAPAPGIYVSPLKENTSISSQDSIESWSRV